MSLDSKSVIRKRIHERIRKKLEGTEQRPRDRKSVV